MTTTEQRLNRVEIKQEAIESSISDLVHEIKEQNKINSGLTTKFSVWAEKHDLIAKEQERIAETLKDQHKEISALREFKADVNPTIQAARGMVQKIMVTIVLVVGGSSMAVAAIVKYVG